MSGIEHHVLDQPGTDHSRPDRNLALELVRVTEAAALAAYAIIRSGRR